MFYDHKQIEQKWQKFWEENQTYKTENNSTKPKFYVLDMFPYPSGAGFTRRSPSGLYRLGYLCKVQETSRF